MPTAYADTNYHTENARLFAEAVGVCTGGALEITVHANGSLFKGDEIKHAVETGAAPIGERFLSAHQAENPVYGFDSVPFLASSFEASDRLLRAGKGPAHRCSRGPEPGGFSIRCPGRRRASTSRARSTVSPT